MIPEKFKIVEAILPQAGAAITSDSINLRDVEMVWIVVQSAGAAANTMLLTPYRDTGNAVAPVVLLNPVQIWVNEATAATDTLVRQADAINHTFTNAQTPKVAVFKIDPATLGATYDWLSFRTGASAAGNITSAIFICQMKYAEDVPPSVIL